MTIIQEQPQGAAASAQSRPLLEEQEGQAQGTDAGTIPIIDPITLAESTKKQPSTVLTTTMTTQFDEIILRQVNPLWLLLIHHYDIIIESDPSMQAQDTPDNSLFSYQIEDLLEEEEISSKAVVLGEVPDEVKAKLQEILQLLNQDIGSLVQDAEGVKGVFHLLKGQLLADVEFTPLPVAFIQGYQLKVLQAMQRLFDHATQAELITKKEASRSRANDIKA